MIMIAAVSAILLIAGVIVMMRPIESVNFLLLYKNSTTLYLLSILCRLSLGVLLIYYAGQTSMAGVNWVIGWLFVVSALIIAFLGRSQYGSLLSWLLTRCGYCMRYAGLLLALFALYLLFQCY